VTTTTVWWLAAHKVKKKKVLESTQNYRWIVYTNYSTGGVSKFTSEDFSTKENKQQQQQQKNQLEKLQFS